MVSYADKRMIYQQRDYMIRRARAAGDTLQELADQFHVSRPRIAQICGGRELGLCDRPAGRPSGSTRFDEYRTGED
jgi:hypothetical protein